MRLALIFLLGLLVASAHAQEPAANLIEKTGVILEADSTPVPGALIRLAVSEAPAIEAKSDAKGKFSLKCPPGRKLSLTQVELPEAFAGRTVRSVEGVDFDANALFLDVSAIKSFTLKLGPIPTTTISGLVSDESGKPVAGATLTLKGSPAFVRSKEEKLAYLTAPSNVPTVLTTVTKADGTYSVIGPLRVYYIDSGTGPKKSLLMLQSPTRGTHPDTAAAPTNVLNARFSMGGGIEADVTDQGGKPVPDAELALLEIGTYQMQPAFSPPSASDTPGIAGGYGIKPGRYVPTINSASKKYAPQTLPPIEIVAGKVVSLKVTLQRGASLRGHVTDNAGKPLAKLSVMGTTTDENGDYKLDGLPTGTVQVSLKDPDPFLDAPSGTESRIMVVAPGEFTKDIVITRLPSTVLTGTVLEADGTPAAAARVSIWSTRSVRGETESPLTDAAGHFRCENLVPGKCSISVGIGTGGSGQDQEEVDLQAIPENKITIRLKPAALLTLRFIDEKGAPVKGAVVQIMDTLRDKSGHSSHGISCGPSDDKGATVIRLNEADTRGFPNATRIMELRQNGDGLIPHPTEINIPRPLAGPIVKVVTLKAGVTLSGRVVDKNGLAVPGIPVTLIKSGEQRYPGGYGGRSLLTDKEGKYTFANVVSAEFDLTADAHSRPELNLADTEPIKVPVAAQDIVRDITLVRGATLKGQIKDVKGKPVLANAHLRRPDMKYARGMDTDHVAGTYDPLEGFTFTALRPGKYSIQVTVTDPKVAAYAIPPEATVEITEGETRQLDVQCQLGGAIEGWLFDPQGEKLSGSVEAVPLDGQKVKYAQGYCDAAAGRPLVIQRLPTGNYRLKFVATDAASKKFAAPETIVTIVGGETLQHDIKLVAAAVPTPAQPPEASKKKEQTADDF
jgi:protocatechuate 3,4-dioxygenase beta subunit